MREYVAAVLAGLVAAATLSGCSGDTDPASPAPTPVAPTPLSELDTSGMTVTRGDFCARIPAEAAEAALDAPVTRDRSWSNGDRVLVAPEERDVVHEYGCAFGSRGGGARAWVFAPPVTRAQARGLVQDLGDRDGCTTPRMPDFGSPSAATLCRVGDETELTLQGLFVDAWLACSVTAPARAGLVDRTAAWCVQVAAAASG